jgi:hypothetical protein
MTLSFVYPLGARTARPRVASACQQMEIRTKPIPISVLTAVTNSALNAASVFPSRRIEISDTHKASYNPINDEPTQLRHLENCRPYCACTSIVGLQLIVWPVLALEERDMARPMARMVITPPQGTGRHYLIGANKR